MPSPPGCALDHLLAAPAARVDLHSHTRFSDGTLTPAELIARASRARVRVLAVTDHDTLRGLDEAAAAARGSDMTILPGMEVSAQLDGRGVHVLAYFPPDRPPELEAWQALRREERRARLVAMIERLGTLGVELDAEAVLAEADRDPRRTPGRPDLARALVAAGHAATFQEAFDRWLGDGKPAHVTDRAPTAGEAIDMIHRLGGLSVVAHPALDDLDARLEQLVELGVDGVEAYHGSHDPAQIAHFSARARGLGLLVTGGSDFHGDHSPAEGRPWRGLGEVGLPAEEWERFARALCAAGEGSR